MKDMKCLRFAAFTFIFILCSLLIANCSNPAGPGRDITVLGASMVYYGSYDGSDYSLTITENLDPTGRAVFTPKAEDFYELIADTMISSGHIISFENKVLFCNPLSPMKSLAQGLTRLKG